MPVPVSAEEAEAVTVSVVVCPARLMRAMLSVCQRGACLMGA